MQIPVQNIYYLLCYAWDKLEEGEKVKVSSSDYEQATELYARVLLNGCTHLFKRGLEHNYLDVTEEYVGIKGKINFNASLNRNSFRHGRAICEFDQFEINILQNQLIKATLRRLIKVINIDPEIRRQLIFFYWKFAGVDDIDIEIKLFSAVRIHRNNAFYDFLLKICRLIIENTVLDESNGNYHFTDFTRNEKAMASLFEAFIRNFYRREQKVFKADREDIQWNAVEVGTSSKIYLPKMQTDISLESFNRKIIIETKFYKEALNKRFDQEKFNSHNLYQLYSYLRSIESKNSHPCNIVSEGILLYPTVDYDISETYMIDHHKISIKTIDLNKPWKEVALNLGKVIE